MKTIFRVTIDVRKTGKIEFLSLLVEGLYPCRPDDLIEIVDGWAITGYVQNSILNPSQGYLEIKLYPIVFTPSEDWNQFLKEAVMAGWYVRPTGV